MKRLLVLLVFAALTACASSDAPAPGVANPILGYDDAAIKDTFAVRAGDRWHLGFSYIRDDPFRVRLGFTSSLDFRAFDALAVLDQPEVGGVASPDVSRAPDGRFVMTYNSHAHDVGAVSEKLYYRTSNDLVTWSDAQRIHIEGADADDDRLIDAAIAFSDAGAFLFFKRGQTASVAFSSTPSPDGPWTVLGALDPPDLENFQPILIDGTWHLLGTTIPLVHRPVLHRLDGDPRAPASWTRWTVVRELEIAEQPWNTGTPLAYERANAAYLADARATEGYFYLLYAGSTELLTFQSRGHSALGLARSRDLVSWEPAAPR